MNPIIVIGELLVDCFPGDHRIGGAPFNVAYHLHRMGWPVRLISRIGDDVHGREILRFLAQVRFPADGVQIDPHHPTGTVAVTVDAQGGPTFDIRADVAYDYVDLTREAVDAPAMAYVGTLVQRTDNGFDQVRGWLSRHCPQHGVFVDLNLRPPHIRDDAIVATLEQAAVAKLSSEELAVVRAIRGGPEGIANGAAWLRDAFGLALAIVTSGGDGAVLATAGQTMTIPAAPVTTMADTVGAGDAFAAVSAMGVLTGQPLDRVGPWAAAFAAAICGEAGAIPRSDAVYSELDKRLRGSL